MKASRLARRTATALAVASAPLWPDTAHAQSLSATHQFNVSGTTCTIELKAYTYEGGAVFESRVPLTSPDCKVDFQTIYGYATDSSGDEVSGVSNGSGQYLSLQLYQGVEITRGDFEIWFAACRHNPCATYTLQPK